MIRHVVATGISGVLRAVLCDGVHHRYGVSAYAGWWCVLRGQWRAGDGHAGVERVLGVARRTHAALHGVARQAQRAQRPGVAVDAVARQQRAVDKRRPGVKRRQIGRAHV